MQAIIVKDGKGPIENLYFFGKALARSPKGLCFDKGAHFGLNGMDPIQRRGEYPLPPGTTDILGVEFSGHVTRAGEDVSKWKEGDEVFGLAIGGAYAEYIAVNEAYLFSKPSHLSWVDAASIPETFITAYQALIKIGQIKHGDNVLIHAAASGVGLAAVQLARVRGAATVIGTASTSEKLEWLRSIPNGATHGVNYRTQDFAKEVKEITKGKGVDIVIDFVGQSHWAGNIEAMAYDGKAILLAALSGFVVKEVDLKQILFKRLCIQGTTLRARDFGYKSALIAGFSHDFASSITGRDGDGPIKTYVQKVYSWKDIHAAHRELEAGKGIGKIVMEVD
ncbi:quinone oxidoreductase putative [Gymnopus androsaceus JB14]|uniref:Quinone oxidoreductase putative n=1 Tax=Gymnopus androsaceus JB14 TaxID=1447944 RepID=A0A6A4HJT5_9AGAR|nr:quinone oxidoreductase putative [Gymnopus androsaceus JB14]